MNQMQKHSIFCGVLLCFMKVGLKRERRGVDTGNCECAPSYGSCTATV